MNISLIDIGNIANDGTGDDLRTAFQKINENFVEVEIGIDASTVAANVGGAVGLYKQKTVNTLEFRSLEAGETLSVAIVNDKVVIDTDFADKNINVGSLTASGNIEGTVITASMFSGSLGGNVMGRVYPQAPDYIIGAGNIIGVRPNPTTFPLLSHLASSGNTATFKKSFKNGQGAIEPSNNIPVAGLFLKTVGTDGVKILSVTDNGTTYTIGLASNFVVYANTNYSFSEPYLPSRVDGIAVKELDRTINTFDFGTIDNVHTSVFTYLLDQIGLDAGTILSPTNLSIDAGTL